MASALPCGHEYSVQGSKACIRKRENGLSWVPTSGDRGDEEAQIPSSDGLDCLSIMTNDLAQT
jgi:hypothetical protein